VPDEFKRALKLVLNARSPSLVELDGARAAAVLIPIVGAPKPSLVFTVRTDNLPSHKGQISFPGGSVDDDDATAEQAALRETNEELGLDPNHVEILGQIDSVPTFVSGYVIHPFVGWVDPLPELQPNRAEVAEVLVIPVDELVEEIRAAPGFTHGDKTFPTEAWIWHDHVIWGATARVVRLLLEMLAEAGLAERPGHVPDWPAAGWRL
jgi:8-oxo-dGTP pyrophosphatase MutT (NUDIX family)